MRVQIPPRALRPSPMDPKPELHSHIRMSAYPGLMRGAPLLAAAATISVAAVLTPVPAMAQPEPSPVVGLVVTREPGTSARTAQALVADELGEVGARTPVAPGVTAVSVPSLDPARAVQAAKSLADADGIAQVDLDTRVLPDAIPDDPAFTEQWALTDPLVGASAVPAWDLTTGAGQVIAVIDTGITVHEDLSANVVQGYDMIEDPVVANDGDGRDFDPADEGDWLTSSEISAYPDQFDGCPVQPRSSWHGTHVAGIAAAVSQNGKGVAGIAPGARIQPIRALGKCGGTMSDIAAAITWASGGEVPGLPLNPTPADVINLSVSSAATCQPFVQAAIDGALSRGSAVVASAGNGARAFTAASPAGCYDIITVGAVDRLGNRAAYSNFGVAGRDLPLFAPGGVNGSSAVSVLSTVNLGATLPTIDGYATSYGTSMAAPLVAGGVALLRAHTGMGPAAVAEHLRDTSRRFPASSNCTGSCGAGILDVNAALKTPPRLPQAPGAVTASPADATMAVTWAAPADPGSADVIGYDVEYRELGGTWIPAGGLWPSTLRHRVVLGLTNGVGYQARVAARTVFGPGPWAQSNIVTPRALPGSVRIQSVRYPNKTSARLALRLPHESLVGIQYRLTRTGRSPQDWRDTTAARTLRLSGLKRGVRYTVEVRAYNETGAGPTSPQDIATPVKPGKIRGLTVKRSGAKARVEWREPKRTGLRIRYLVRAGQGQPWQPTKKTTVVLRKVPSGPVRFQVRARNEAGRGPIGSILKRR